LLKDAPFSIKNYKSRKYFFFLTVVCQC